MTLEQIKIEAQKEGQSENPNSLFARVLQERKRFPDGMDIQILKLELIPELINICDSHKIPIFHVTEGTVSTAETYCKLLKHETDR